MSTHRVAPGVALILMTAAAGTGCASANASAPVQGVNPRQAVIYSGPDAPTMYADAARAAQHVFTADPARVWAAVKQTYLDYGIPVTIENPTAKQIGNPDFYRTRQFMGRPMTELLSCGSSMTGPNAATFRIFMSLLTQVAGDGAGKTTVGVTFVASARDMSGGSSGDRLPCGNTGLVDQRFLAQVEKNLNR